MRLEWQEQVLLERYADEKNAALAEELGVSVRAVERWAAELGLRKLCRREPWMDEVLKAEFGRTGNEELARKLGCSAASVSRWAHRLGLEKDPEHWHLFRKGERAFSGDAEWRRKNAIWEAAAEERKLEREGLPPKRRWRKV